MLNKVRGILQDNRGSAFIENGLWIVIVVLLCAAAGYTLAKEGIEAKFTEIQSQVDGAIVPDIDGN